MRAPEPCATPVTLVPAAASSNRQTALGASPMQQQQQQQQQRVCQRQTTRASSEPNVCACQQQRHQQQIQRQQQPQQQQQRLHGCSSSPALTPTEFCVPKASTGAKFANLVSEGIRLENIAVGLQHKMLLGMSRGEQQGAKGAQPTTLHRLMEEAGDFLERACFSSQFLHSEYLKRLAFVTVFFFTAAYLNALATMISTHRNPYMRRFDLHGQPLDKHTMPDLGHDLWAFVLTRLGHHTDFIDEHSLPDRLVGALGYTTLLGIAFHPRRFLIFRRVFVIFGLLLLLRAVSVSVTVLPDASPTCYKQFSSAAGRYKHEALFPRAFIEAAYFVVAPTSAITCGDMMFSGHTTCLMLCALVFRKYCRQKHLHTKVFFRSTAATERVLTPVRHFVYAYCACSCLVVVGSKLHYTLDVIAAVLLSWCAFKLYHVWIRIPSLRKKVRLLAWLEDDSVLGVDNITYERAKRD